MGEILTITSQEHGVVTIGNHQFVISNETEATNAATQVFQNQDAIAAVSGSIGLAVVQGRDRSNTSDVILEALDRAGYHGAEGLTPATVSLFAATILLLIAQKPGTYVFAGLGQNMVEDEFAN